MTLYIIELLDNTDSYRKT